MQEEPFVSVVVTVLNAEATIARCLDSLLSVDYPQDRCEIIIVDALSADRTRQIVREYSTRAGGRPSVRLLERAGTIGAGRNEGIRNALGDFVAVTDADVAVDPQWLRELLNGFGLGGRVGAVGGPNNSATDDVVSRTIGCLPVHGPSLEEVPLLGRNRYGESFVSDSDWYTNVTRNSMFRRDALAQVGGFAEELISTEDPELNHRLHLAGWKTAYNPRAVVHHFHPASLRAFHRQMKHYAYGHAHTTVRKPYMRKPKQFLPSLALAAVVALVAAAAFWPAALWLLLAALAAGLGLVALYGVRCALARRDPRLALTAPIYLLAWQWAWAWQYPRGLLRLPEDRLLPRKAG